MPLCWLLRGLDVVKPSKLQKLLALSGSSNEHEATVAAVMLAKGLREAGVDLEKALTRRRTGPAADFVGVSARAQRYREHAKSARQAAWEEKVKAAQAAREKRQQEKTGSKQQEMDWDEWAKSWG